MKRRVTHGVDVANRPDIIIKNEEREIMRCGNISKRKVAQKETENKLSTRVYE